MLKTISLISIAVFFCFSCEKSKIPWFWKTYEHPTYGFSIQYPRDWKVQEEGLLGAQATFLSPETRESFRSNGNVVVQEISKRQSLTEIADQSERQLSFLLNDYKLLSRAAVKLGNLSAIELRGRYQAQEGKRIVRSFIALTKDLQYVFTFTCSFDQEAKLQKTVQKMIHSFNAPASLSP